MIYSVTSSHVSTGFSFFYSFFSQPNSISTAQTLDDDPIFNEMTRAEATKLKNAVCRWREIMSGISRAFESVSKGIGTE